VKQGKLHPRLTRTHTMQVEVFKTNIETKQHADMVINLIKTTLPVDKITFDLEDCDRILRIEANEIELQPIQNLLLNSGFTCIPLE
jgi:tRNA G26 N,N-dimethylase Trm1